MQHSLGTQHRSSFKTQLTYIPARSTQTCLTFQLKVSQENEEDENLSSWVWREGLQKGLGVPSMHVGGHKICLCLTPGAADKGILVSGGALTKFIWHFSSFCSSKCPTINSCHESHLALDRESLFSGERGSCSKKDFNEGGYIKEARLPCSLYRHIVGSLSTALTIEGVQKGEGEAES